MTNTEVKIRVVEILLNAAFDNAKDLMTIELIDEALKIVREIK